MNRYAQRVGEMKPSAIRQASKMIAAKEGCISFAAGNPAGELMPMEALADVTDSLIRQQGRTTLQYGMTRGNKKLVAEIIKMMAEKNIPCTPENIQVTTGSQQGIFLTGMLMLDRGDGVIVENPTYLGALTSYTPLGCRYIDVDADEEGMLMDQLEEKLKTEANIKLIYVVPNFSNPTGKLWSLERRKRLLSLATAYNVMIVEDDPYGDIRFDGEAVPSLKSMDKDGRVIYLGSFSKVLYAGLRVGFTVSSTEIANSFELFKNGIDLQSNELSQSQIAAYLARHSLKDQIDKIVTSYGEKRDLMLRLIDETFPDSIKRTSPVGGMFVWLELPEHMDAMALLPRCIEEANVGYVPGGPFFANGGKKNTARLNFSSVDKGAIEVGIRCLAKFFHEAVKEK